MPNRRTSGGSGQQPVEPGQRFTKDRPCPVCHGYPDLPRGQGVRCWGLYTSNGKGAVCMQIESERPVKSDEELGWYHRLDSLRVTEASNGREVDLEGAVYPYTDEKGNILYVEVRTAGKRFRLEGPNG